jgi:NAD(P)-dependent dehydrogenase (short-subunit alcohol dehydrogenase family)
MAFRFSPRRSVLPERPVVVVTGASAGLGRAIAEAFARRGARIGLLARDSARLDAATADVRRLGGEALAYSVDVADAEGVEAAATAVEERFGPIDVWVNNAMASVFGRVHNTTAAEFARVTEVSYLGTVYGTLSALRRMRPRDQGAIVQVGSALAYRGIPLQAAYCGAKHAIQGFCDSLRSELLHERSRVRLSMVQMPALNTPQFEWSRSHMPRKPQPVPPIFDPAVGAEAVVYAAASGRREIYVGSPTVVAIVGDKIAPWLGDWYLARRGFEAQQRDELDDPDRPDNLYDPYPGSFGARGPFGGVARRFSWQLWLTRHRALAAALLGVSAALGAAALLRGSSVRRTLN